MALNLYSSKFGVDLYYRKTDVYKRQDFKVFIYVCAAAIFLKLMEFFMRFML